MKKNIFIAAIAALTLSLTACQKDDVTNSGNNSNVNPNARVKTTADLNNTAWTYSVSYADFLTGVLGANLDSVESIGNGALDFGLSFDGTYAHFTFPQAVEDNNGAGQITGVDYTYTYDGTTHTGYLNGMAEDVNGNPVPTQLQFSYNDATDIITFNLNLFYVDDETPLTLTLNFSRNNE